MRPKLGPLVEQAVGLGALVVALLLQRSRGGLELGFVAFVLLLLGPAAWRWEAANGRVTAAPRLLRVAEAISLLGLLAFYPRAPWVLMLGSLVTASYAARAFVPGRDVSASEVSFDARDLARVAVLLGLASSLRAGHVTPALPAFVLIEFKASRLPPGQAADRARQCALLALVAAGEMRPAFIAAPEALAQIALSCLIGIGVLTRTRGQTFLERGITLVLALVLVHETSRLLPMEARIAQALATLVVVGMALTVFFLTASALTPASSRRPSTLGAMLAAILAAGTTAVGASRFRGLEQSGDLAHHSAWPLCAVAKNDIFEPGLAAREDFRARTFTPRPEPGVFRVLLLGGSSAWGHGQPRREESPAGSLERALATRLSGKRVEVVCLAVPGFTSDQELGVLVGARLLGWEADLVLALDGYNDVNYLAGSGTYPGDMYVWPQHRHALTYPVRRTLCIEAPALRFLFAGPAVLPPSRAEDWLSEANDFYLDGLVTNEASLAVLAQEIGARFAWTSAPLVYDLPRLSTAESGAPRTPPFGEVVRRRTAEARRLVAAAVSTRGGIVLDLPVAVARRRERSRDDDSWFLDDCHYTDQGVAVLSEELAQLLSASGSLTSR